MGTLRGRRFLAPSFAKNKQRTGWAESLNIPAPHLPLSPLLTFPLAVTPLGSLPLHSTPNGEDVRNNSLIFLSSHLYTDTFLFDVFLGEGECTFVILWVLETEHGSSYL